MESPSQHRPAERASAPMAVTWFCLRCFKEVGAQEKRCPVCGADLVAMDAEELDTRLARALNHRLSSRRMIAALVLGNRRAVSAVPALAEIAQQDDDPFVSAQAVRALARIGTEDAIEVVRRVAADGSVVPRRAARNALEAVPAS
jgi:HEAT repeat protein